MLHPSDHLRTVIDQDGAVILDVRQGKIVRCNQTGAAIFDLLSRGYDQEQIATEFSRLYEISQASASEDVCAFLTSLQARGLLGSGVADKSQG
jgi:hypothetical protein